MTGLTRNDRKNNKTTRFQSHQYKTKKLIFLGQYAEKKVMKISESQIMMQSDHTLGKKQVKEESLRAWIGNSRPDFEQKNSALPSSDTVTLSIEALQKAVSSRVSNLDTPVDETLPSEDPKITTIRMIIESITGRKIEAMRIADLSKDPETQAMPQDSSETGTENAGWGIEYDLEESYSEKEMTNFSASGTIVTSDGERLDFSLDLSLKREFSQSSSIHLRAGDAKKIDPLVINFAGSAAQLSDLKFAFDLNGDGSDEQISSLLPGSGFLFIDKDGNGTPTNGTELFGPQTNHGFQELSQYDLDQNGWIDENDPVFDRLQIWEKDIAGNDSFSSLTDKGIGALYLQAQQTKFNLTNQENTLNGTIEETSIFLTENFKAGTIQEINLTV